MFKRLEESFLWQIKFFFHPFPRPPADELDNNSTMEDQNSEFMTSWSIILNILYTGVHH